MAERKPQYRIEVEMEPGRWAPIPTLTGIRLEWGKGYVWHHRDAPGPRCGLRLVREADGRVIDTAPGGTEVSIGMFAGWPTAAQYERAAARALEMAAKLRELEARAKQRETAEEGE